LGQVQSQPTPAGVVISALRGGSGKTILSIGITAALGGLGYTVAPFKKGPDYIDAGWLALAAGRPCYNLDTYLVPTPQILDSFHRNASACDVSVVEGNRGLYDSIDTDGQTSTAELAKLLHLPVILCIDCTKTTRTMAAVVAGCEMFDPAVDIRGVILNRVAGQRHETILRRSIEQHCGIRVVGSVPKLEQHFPERHMGLVPTPEHQWAAASIDGARRMAQQYLDLPAELEMAGISDSGATGETRSRSVADPAARRGQAAPRSAVAGGLAKRAATPAEGQVRIGILRDAAFQFYYPENIDALQQAGAEVIYTSPLKSAPLPAVDALYIGGGFPETHARELAANEAYRRALETLAGEGLPIYAECGGLMYLGRALELGSERYPMANVLPLTFVLCQRPQGHGYTEVVVDRPNPYYPEGTAFRGHEFHYSKVVAFEADTDQLVFDVRRGSGIAAGRDGMCRRNVLATYTHIHALGLPRWARALVRNARRYRQRRAADSRRGA
jgi:cobyrinic acid a,c-diamide synthase